MLFANPLLRPLQQGAISGSYKVSGRSVLRHYFKTVPLYEAKSAGPFNCLFRLTVCFLLSELLQCGFSFDHQNYIHCHVKNALPSQFNQFSKIRFMKLSSLHTMTEEFENAAFFSPVRLAVFSNLLRKQSFLKTLFKSETLCVSACVRPKTC